MDISTLSKGLNSLPPVRTDFQNKEELKEYFRNTWEIYEMLFKTITHEGALYVAPDPLRHPLVFYLGHTAVFYINKFVISGSIPESERINPEFEVLFAQGVDPARAEELGSEAWPRIDEVWEYRKLAYDRVMRFIDETNFPPQTSANDPQWSLFMGLEHDRIHFETSSMLIRQYPADWLTQPAAWNYAPSEGTAPENQWIDVPGGTANLGKSEDFPTFGWDNEYGSLTVEVDEFQATQNLITNQEFLAFQQSGGYHNAELWTEKGWKWRSEFKVEHPRFWVPEGADFRYRAMFDELDMPMAWPVEVNCHEATAYCNWKGGRLLSEAEFLVIADTAVAKPFDLPYSDDFNLNVKFGSPNSVGSISTAKSSLGINDVWGNVWCWLNNDFYPFEGFEIHPYYEDFSAIYMDEQHATLLGGSWASSGTSASKYYRLWFRRHFYQHAGFRMAK